jgi:hypothetical protein
MAVGTTMPQMANIATKNNALAVVNLIAVQPSNGAEPAVWQDQSVATLASLYRPELTFTVRKASNGAAYRSRSKFVNPVTSVNPATGQVTVVGTQIIEVNCLSPRILTDAQLKDGFAMAMHAQLSANGPLAVGMALGQAMT